MRDSGFEPIRPVSDPIWPVELEGEGPDYQRHGQSEDDHEGHDWRRLGWLDGRQVGPLCSEAGGVGRSRGDCAAQPGDAHERAGVVHDEVAVGADRSRRVHEVAWVERGGKRRGRADELDRDLA